MNTKIVTETLSYTDARVILDSLNIRLAQNHDLSSKDYARRAALIRAIEEIYAQYNFSGTDTPIGSIVDAIKPICKLCSELADNLQTLYTAYEKAMTDVAMIQAISDDIIQYQYTSGEFQDQFKKFQCSIDAEMPRVVDKDRVVNSLESLLLFYQVINVDMSRQIAKRLEDVSVEIEYRYDDS